MKYSEKDLIKALEDTFNQQSKVIFKTKSKDSTKSSDSEALTSKTLVNLLNKIINPFNNLDSKINSSSEVKENLENEIIIL